MEKFRLLVLVIIPPIFFFLGTYFRQAKGNPMAQKWGLPLTYLSLTQAVLLMVGEFLIERVGEISYWIGFTLMIIVTLAVIVYGFLRPTRST